MPTGPKGEKRPADVIGNAVKIMRIATGEESETTPAESSKNAAAQELGRKGGKTRARSLSPERRSEIARAAAATRWNATNADGSPIAKAISTGILGLGSIPCAVLDDAENTRVLTQSGFLSAIGRFPNPPSASRPDLVNIPAFLRAKNLEPFISNDLIRSSTPIFFDSERTGGAGGTRAIGYKAELLPAVCWVYQEAKTGVTSEYDL